MFESLTVYQVSVVRVMNGRCMQMVAFFTRVYRKGGHMGGEYKYVKVCISRRREWFNSYKAGKACRMCGIVYPPHVMDWHHKDRKTKSFNISRASFTRSRESLLAEIAKCELLCANCHRIEEHRLKISVAVENGYSSLSHKQTSVGSSPTPATNL